MKISNFNILCVLAIYSTHCMLTWAQSNVNVQDVVNKLFDKVLSYQVLKEKHYTPPFSWYEKQGLFKSDIRVNFFGNPLVQELRNGPITAVFDNDMFSTAWILTALFDSLIYGKNVPAIDDHRLQLALEAIGSYSDKNDPAVEKTIKRTFWPQTFNSTYTIWQQQPINIRNIVLNVEKIPFDAIEKILKDLHLDKEANLVEMFKQFTGTALDAFSIPPDFDDTYVNLGLGCSLYKLKNLYGKLYESWLSNNTDTDRLISDTINYSYQPFDSDLNKNIIDPRTYFFAREFLHQSLGQPLSLITTWIQNVEEQRKLKDERVSMPFNVNNVDVTVGANSIHGITAAAIYNIDNFGDKFVNSPNLIQTYLNTTKFISWSIKSNFSSRPDLAQVYYPSTYNFMWYASRTLFLIENESQNLYRSSKVEYATSLRSLNDILKEAKSYLKDAFENEATGFLLRSAVRESNTKTYFRDFLGLNDTSLTGKPESNDDDALFSTAQAINILISTWTIYNQQSKALNWKKNTPKEVHELIKTSVTWLSENVLGNKYKPLNAFFSGSVKGLTSLPFWYPANFAQFLNGTFVDPSTAASLQTQQLENVINGVSGYIDEPTYKQLLNQTHYGLPTPLDFPGYNVKSNTFPFWSSEPYTYAVSLLALSQFNNIQ